MASLVNGLRRGGHGAIRTVRFRTFDGRFGKLLRARLSAERDVDTTWPAGPGTRYYDRPDLFAEEVLGLKLKPFQTNILLAAVRRSFTVVSSGRKIGKTMLAACLALWWYCTRPKAQVLLTATTAGQVNGVLWRELRLRCKFAEIKIDGQLNQTAAYGLVSDFRVIRGFSVDKREAAAGTSGTEILYIVDEASGVSDAIFETLEGNMAAGGCKLFAISNPTQNEGWHFKAFHPSGTVKAKSPVHSIDEASDMETFCISSRTVAEEDQGRTPGLATVKYCDRQLRRHGEDSAEYCVHVLGRHVAQDEGRAMSLALVTRAVNLHASTDIDYDAPLTIGLDPAGATAKSDLSGFAVRRGAKIITIVPLKRGATRDEIIAELRDILDTYRAYNHERAYVVFDVGGDVGARLLPNLREVEKAWRFHLVPVRSSDVAVRHTAACKRRSAELVWNFKEWLKSGGTIPDDENLVEECRAWEFKREAHDDKRVKVNKDEVRKRLGRSPDMFDACALAVWDVTDLDVRRAAPQPGTPWAPDKKSPQPFHNARTGGGSVTGSGLDPFSPRNRRV